MSQVLNREGNNVALDCKVRCVTYDNFKFLPLDGKRTIIAKGRKPRIDTRIRGEWKRGLDKPTNRLVCLNLPHQHQSQILTGKKIHLPVGNKRDHNWDRVGEYR